MKVFQHHFCFDFFFLNACMFIHVERITRALRLPAESMEIENSFTFTCGNRIESGSIIYLIPLLVFPFESEWSGWAPSRAHTIISSKIVIPSSPHRCPSRVRFLAKIKSLQKRANTVAKMLGTHRNNRLEI